MKKLDINTKEIWEEFSDGLRRFIFKRVQNEHDAEDILQDLFCKIHNKVHNLKDEDKLGAWIYQIARNTITDYYRHQKVLSKLPETLADESDVVIKVDTNDNVASCLKPMIDNLPPRYREATLLTEFQGLSQKEMAERLGLSLSGGKSRVQRAREKLKDMLLKCCHLEFDRLNNIIDYQPKEQNCRYCSGEQTKE